MTLIPRANAAIEMATQHSISTYPVMDLLVTNAINTALASGLRSCTYSTSGKSSQDVQAAELFLAEQGYQWSASGTTVTVTW